MNALLSQGTWHCKMAILIYLYFIALSFLSNIGTITSQNFPAIPSQKHHSESSHLSFSCLRFYVIFSVKQLKHSKIWNCHLGYCNTKYVDDHSYPINSFCYLQLKSTNPINTIFFFYMSIHWSYHVEQTLLWIDSICSSVLHISSITFNREYNKICLFVTTFYLLHCNTSWLIVRFGGCCCAEKDKDLSFWEEDVPSCDMLQGSDSALQGPVNEAEYLQRSLGWGWWAASDRLPAETSPLDGWCLPLVLVLVIKETFWLSGCCSLISKTAMLHGEIPCQCLQKFNMLTYINSGSYGLHGVEVGHAS